MTKNIKLVENTITNQEIDQLVNWLSTYPRLTKGSLTEEFENNWADWLGVKYSVFVNSGSSANLLMLYALQISGRLKNNKVIAPSVSWATTISPLIQLGFDPILCETDRDKLGVDIEDLEELCKIHEPSCLIIVHVLGFPNKMKEIKNICDKYDVLLLEDSCESVGSIYEDKKTGTFGIASTFSTYYGHHFSTIEGGLICTNDFEIYELLKCIRSHGWDRDLSDSTKEKLKKDNDIDEFSSLYTFYYPGFNVRSTDLQAFIGINQLKTLNKNNQKRYENFLLYDKLIINDYWKIKHYGVTSNFAYPVIHPLRNQIASNLKKNNIECRPLVCGNMARQPFFYKRYETSIFDFSNIVHEYGMYVPNHPNLQKQDIIDISNIINDTIC